MADIEKNAAKEKLRLIRILKAAEVSQNRMEILKPTIENVAWMKAKLDDARELIKESNVPLIPISE